MVRLRGALLAGAGLAILCVAFRDLGLGLGGAARALAVVAVGVVPAGYLLTRGPALDVLLPVERLLLLGLVGWPVAAAGDYALGVLGLRAIAPALALLLAGAAAVLMLRDGAHRRLLAGWGVHDGFAVVLLALALLVATRGNRPFVAVGESIAYNHSRDHTLHLSFYQELMRGVPPAEVPSVAGLPFPRYHVLGYLLGVRIAEHAHVEVTAVYHAVTPLFHLALLFGGVFMAVRLRTGDPRLGAAAVVVVGFVSHGLENVFHDRLVWGTPPLFFGVRSVSGGAGIALWTAVIGLLLLYERLRTRGDLAAAARMLYLAALLAGVSVFVKAQAFLLFGTAFVLGLAVLAWRDRSRPALLALALALASALVLFESWRPPGVIGRLSFVPGLFARNYVFPVLRRDPLPFVSQTLLGLLQALPAGWIPATLLGLWRILNCSVLVPVFLWNRLRALRRLEPADLMVCSVLVLALPMALGLAATEVYGESDALVFREAAYALPMLAAAVDVAVLARILRRGGRDGGRWVLAGALAAAGALVPALGPPELHDQGDWIVLGPEEQCALLFLREATPAGAVVATPGAPQSAGPGWKWNNHAVVAGLAGRRSVLEFYDKGIDPRNDRHRDLRRLYATSDRRLAETILRRYAADHVLEFTDRPLAFPKDGLRLAFASPAVNVYRFGPGPDLPRWDPACGRSLR